MEYKRGISKIREVRIEGYGVDSDSENDEEHGYFGDEEEEWDDINEKDPEDYDSEEEKEAERMEDATEDAGAIPLPWYQDPPEYNFWEHPEPWIGNIIGPHPAEGLAGYRGLPRDGHMRVLNYEEPWDLGEDHPVPDEYRNADSDIEERGPVPGDGPYRIIRDEEEEEEETEIARAA